MKHQLKPTSSYWVVHAYEGDSHGYGGYHCDYNCDTPEELEKKIDELEDNYYSWVTGVDHVVMNELVREEYNEEQEEES